jgi:hypothetical protein
MMVNAEETMVDVGLLLQAIHDAGFAGIEDAAAACETAPASFKKLLDFRGELPRCDALFRICDRLNISLKELVINAAAHKKKTRPQGRLLPGGWRETIGVE